MSENELRHYRGNRIAMIFQDPMTSLNPVYRIGWQIQEAIQAHNEISDVRGMGLMLAMEFRTADQAAALVQSAFERGLLLLTAGTRAVRICPPLVIDRDEAATALEIITAALD